MKPRHLDAQESVCYDLGVRDATPRWLPMDTAPKDGTTILVHDGNTVLTVRWTATTEHRKPDMRWVLQYWDGLGRAPIPEDDLYNGLGTTFLGWQPLPKPPAAP